MSDWSGMSAEEIQECLMKDIDEWMKNQGIESVGDFYDKFQLDGFEEEIADCVENIVEAVLEVRSERKHL